MAQKMKAEDVSAMATLHMARQYHEAADELFAVNERRKGTVDQYKIDDPVYLLYFQTVELALKAFLRSHGLPIAGTNRKGHNLKALHEECQALGLKLGADDRLTIGNIIGLLVSGNVDHGFRYYSKKATSLPDLSWTREVVADLMRVVAPEVVARDIPPAKPSVKGVMTFPKPTPKVTTPSPS